MQRTRKRCRWLIMLWAFVSSGSPISLDKINGEAKWLSIAWKCAFSCAHLAYCLLTQPGLLAAQLRKFNQRHWCLFSEEVIMPSWFPLDLEILMHCTRNDCKVPSRRGGESGMAGGASDQLMNYNGAQMTSCLQGSLGGDFILRRSSWMPISSQTSALF